MPYAAAIHKIMIASPSDVKEERGLVRDIVQEWNSIHSEDRKIVLMPIGWETHSSPAMGNRPQAIINRQVLRDCDLLVAVFWTRLGSPTGASPSGTVEEIEEHLAAGKAAMIYFSSQPVTPGSVDPEQYQALIEFKKRCMERGLIEEYCDIAEFGQKFSRQLAQTVIQHFGSFEQGDDDLIDLPVPSAPALSDATRELLIEAAQSTNGIILCVGNLSGLDISTNNRRFVEDPSPRTQAKWKAAVDQLEEHRLIEDMGHKRQVFRVTDEGYRVADLLRNQ